MSTNLRPGPIEVILSISELEHIALCHPRYGQQVQKNGIRWFNDGTIIQYPWESIPLPCRGECNKQKAIFSVFEDQPLTEDMIQTLQIGTERFSISFLLGECPICRVIHAARAIEP